MNRGGFLILGIGGGMLAYWLFKAYQPSAITTANDEAGGFFSGGDDLLDVAYSTIGAIMPGNMEISLAGLSHLKRVEGYSATPYRDIAGFWTGGYGHKLGAMEHRNPRTEAEWSAILAKDVSTAEAAVNRLVKVPLTQGQFDALVSFVYNVGAGAFGRSTMLANLNAGNYAGAAQQFTRWVYAGGKTSSGLLNRRYSEIALFNSAGGNVA